MQFRRSLSLTAALVTVLIHTPAASQVIDFETGGLRYKTLSKGGFTVMFAPLPTTIRNYAVLQVAVANGSGIAWPVKPEDFRFERADGTSIQAVAASRVISELLDKGGRNDVIKLVSTYEAGLYGLPRFQSTNGYQVRRQHALAEVQSTRIKAAAAASAIAFVPVKLNPGQSSDGAVFYPSGGKPLGPGRLVVRAAGEIFDFTLDADAPRPALELRGKPND
jgi:hypothetical protein